MTAVFLKLLNMSIAASWLVLAVILVRGLFRKAPGWFKCLLWGIVGLRLALPANIESRFSLIPSPQLIPPDVTVSQTPAIYSGIPAVNEAVNPLVTQHFPTGGNGLEVILRYASYVWLAGVGLMLLFGAVSWLRLRYQVRVSIPMGANTYLCDDIGSPFLMGIFRPKIYIPSGMTEEQLTYGLAHERAHLKRRDHLWKSLGFLLLMVYWFNPLLWVAYILLGRDIERACDEKVIAGLDPAGKMGYSAALAACSMHRRMVMVCPVAFGELSVKTRIKEVLHYKKPTVWLICASVLLCALTAACFLTNPMPCSHEYAEEIIVQPTCTATGLSTQVCSHCRHSYTVRVEVAAHTYDAGVVTKISDCTHTGSKTLECVVCGLQKTEVLEKTGHIAAGTVRLKEPNCTEEGTLGILCSCCDAIFMTQLIPRDDTHDLQEHVLTAPTCVYPGEGAYICTRCGLRQECTYEALGHTFAELGRSEGTCLYPGNIRMECTVCKYTYTIETPVKGHDWQEIGNGYKQCRVCGWRTKPQSLLTPTHRDTYSTELPKIQIWP